MYAVTIRIKDGQQRFLVGETVSGVAEVTIPAHISLSNVALSFNCLGEVKWVEYHGTPRYMNNHICYDRHYYHKEVLEFYDNVNVDTDDKNIQKKVTIPFSFEIPKDKNLPSTMISNHGFVKYFVLIKIKKPQSEEVLKKFFKEVIVQAPFEKDLMITVGATAEKHVLLHNGHVSMHATIGRKGFVAGETITVHVTVDNKTNTKVVPQVDLRQVQIFMCDETHKTVETTLNDQPVVGTEVAPHTKVEELLDLTIPPNEALSIKSSLITVKYFIHVTLEIPHSFDLHVNLPVVVTSWKILEQMREKRNEPEMVSAKKSTN